MEKSSIDPPLSFSPMNMGRLFGLNWIVCAAILGANAIAQGKELIVDAGLPRYTAGAPVVLRGDAPDFSEDVAYAWKQRGGPEVRIYGADTPSPTISGFKATGEQQRCTFELTVREGEGRAASDSVDVIIVPALNKSRMRFESRAFDSTKPTFVYFGGGNCVTSHEGTESWNGGAAWHALANVISFYYYEPDQGFEGSDDIDFEKVMAQERTYFSCADRLLTYLSRVAPDYDQPIQTAGFSTGGQPALDTALRFNSDYDDPRYRVPRVTLLDAYCRDYEENISAFIASGSEVEQRWIDNYVSTSFEEGMKRFYPNVLNVKMGGRLAGNHDAPPIWYANSLTREPLLDSNNGVVAGAFWSVIGPGRNLQLGAMNGTQTYFFAWKGSLKKGKMGLMNEEEHPGRLPEPVSLVAPRRVDGSDALVLTCKPSANAITYEVLIGPSPDSVSQRVRETSTPPTAPVADLPDDAAYWTIRVRDAHGTTIHADPIPLPKD